MKTKICLALSIFLGLSVLAGCRMDDIAKTFPLIGTRGDTISKATEQFTPEQEHYLGRAVAARIVQKYSALKNDKANSYLNQVGQALAMNSKQPFTYGGYHFLLLDSNETNSFAAPDGLIFVTKGMLGLISTESELAAVLAHEITHVQNKDAVKAIQSSRMTETLLLLGKDATSQYTNKLPDKKLVELFSSSVDDIVVTMVSNGYSRSQEYAADAGAKEILALTGYNPEALADMLRVMEKRVSSGSPGLAATHPSATDRLAAIKSTGTKGGKEDNERARRFKAALGPYAHSAK